MLIDANSVAFLSFIIDSRQVLQLTKTCYVKRCLIRSQRYNKQYQESDSLDDFTLRSLSKFDFNSIYLHAGFTINLSQESR